MDVKRIVNKIVRDHDSRDPFTIMRRMKVILVICPLVRVRGFYQYFERNHIVYVNEDLPEHERRFVCAHELGHMILHKHSNAIFLDTYTYLGSKYEVEADRFAMELLISDEMIIETGEYGFTMQQAARMWGYREKLVEMRIRAYLKGDGRGC